MKKLLLLFVLCSVAVGCGASYMYGSVQYWLERETLPSEIQEHWNITGKFNDNKTYKIGYELTSNDDAEFYYEILMKDFGWYRNAEGGFSSSDGRRVNRGSLYVSPKRGVAIYFHPGSTYTVFKAEISD
jgi:hypothetical protein